VGQFKNIKSRFMEALAEYSAINSNYKSKGGQQLKERMEESRKNVDGKLKKYIEAMNYLNREDVLKEYREALKLNDTATREYHPYLAISPLAEGENPPAIPFHELHAVSDKLWLAQLWLDLLRKLLSTKN